MFKEISNERATQREVSAASCGLSFDLISVVISSYVHRLESGFFLIFSFSPSSFSDCPDDVGRIIARSVQQRQQQRRTIFCTS